METPFEETVLELKILSKKFIKQGNEFAETAESFRKYAFKITKKEFKEIVKNDPEFNEIQKKVNDLIERLGM